mmetsp:Transcript_21863/g.42990  ORF Transcript_21863/g.42990 Transcript_21863/m.42990 type:complete len:83 (-) Transcript_21863:458-706(-)
MLLYLLCHSENVHVVSSRALQVAVLVFLSSKVPLWSGAGDTAVDFVFAFGSGFGFGAADVGVDYGVPDYLIVPSPKPYQLLP